MLTEQLFIFFKSRICVLEDDPHFLEVFLHVVVNHFGLILSRYTGKVFLLCFRDSKLIERLLDFFRNFIPAALGLLRWLHVICDIIEIQFLEISSPLRHRHIIEMIQ